MNPINPPPKHGVLALLHGLAGLRDERTSHRAPRHLESNLREEFRSHRATSLSRTRRWLMVLHDQLAMPTLVIGTFLICGVIVGPRVLLNLNSHDRGFSTVATPFYSLQNNDELTNDASGVVVPTEISRTALADFGFPVDPGRADEPVKAELLVGRSGELLAVRFIQH